MKKIIRSLVVCGMIVLAMLSIQFLSKKEILPTQNEVLAESNEQRPRLYIYGGKYDYRSGGVIPLSSLDEPYLDVDAYGISGTAKVTFYKGNKEILLDYLLHDEKNNQI